MNIAFDLDGVLYPWHTAAYNYLKETRKDITASFRDLWAYPYANISKEDWDYLASIPLLYSIMIPTKKILEMLSGLDKEGHTIYYITNRHGDLERITRKYLDDYNFPQAFNLIHTEDKGMVVRTLEIDIIVEDKPKNLESLVGLCRTIGIEQVWNEDKRDYLESLGVLFIPSVECLTEIL
jgi:uncharacterized HAD superfamily protein